MNEWKQVHELVQWLNSHNEVDSHEVAMRLMKIGEEFGEVMEAYGGVYKQNPRKDDIYTRFDVMYELCDVITTAMVALVTFSDDLESAQMTFEARLKVLTDRIDTGKLTHD